MKKTKRSVEYSSPAADSPIFDTRQAAGFLGVDAETMNVWRCTRKYEIPYLKIGRLVRYRRADLEAFLNSREVDRR